MLVYKLRDASTQQFVVRVELNNHPFTQRWKDYFIRTLTRCPNLQWYSNTLNSPAKKFNIEECLPLITKIKIALKLFSINPNDNVVKELGCLKQVLLDPASLTQQDLNLWHRTFTRLGTKYFHPDAVMPNGMDTALVHKLIHDINTSVHHLESYTRSNLPRRNTLLKQPQEIYTASCMDAVNLNYATNGVWSIGHYDLIEPGGFDFNTNDYNYSVWLNEDIQGKDQIRAWLDHDDLTQDDITGNILMTPNIMFDPNMTYSRIIDNEEFRIESRLSNKTIDRYPLGNIVDPEKVKWDRMFRAIITEITLDDRVLYEL